MYRNDRNVDSFNLVNALQPVFRNTGCGMFEYDRKKQNETADSILRALALNADFASALKQYVRINSVRRVVQFDDGSVRYGIHAEFEGHNKINSFRIFKDEDTDAFDSYFYSVCDNKAELVDFKMDSLDIQLQAVFEKVTGIFLSH
ncbi:Uncharacterised protein [Enterobacter hormaechei]|uniref:hypothetical protein n=1 Tax=Enterobacter hormaechei TaxID=158836 RepID=UPI000791C7A2|nr:hypothetical protein [Enterobacter hormaechei]CZY50621.1 Uncharacterised protein [Enterobacter hormaechei]